jgi:alkylhydroperoxidase/carboxymuconolactone decarboxylase family protein YurZ
LAENPLQTIIDEDLELFNLLQDSYKLAFAEGKISVKYKILIVMSLDAAHGAVDGVKALAKQAIRQVQQKKR